MQKIYFFLFLLPLVAKSQSNKVDSAWYYQHEMSKMLRAAQDSVMNLEEYKLLERNFRRAESKSNDYVAFSLFTEVAHADYRDFNKSITASGFPALDEYFARIGFGISGKDGHLMYNVYYAIFGINNTSTHNGAKIKTSSNDVFYFDLGYDLLKSNTFSLYPYAGLSLRSSTLRYVKDAEMNQDFTNVTDIIINDQSVKTSSTKVGYHAGIGFDIRLSRYKYEETSKTVRGGNIPSTLFFRFGTNLPIGKETYNINGTKYKPGIRQGDWGITVGIKFP